MKLIPPDKPIGDNGPNVFPWVCPHCYRCYWLYPGVDIVARRSLARPEEMEEDACREAWQAEDIADNIGLKYAMELIEWAKQEGMVIQATKMAQTKIGDPPWKQPNVVVRP